MATKQEDTTIPVFEFSNPESGETISVMVPLSSPKEAFHVQIGEDGKVYKRVYAAPLTAKDTSIKDGTKEDFRRLTTDKKNLTIGQMWELSAELSEHRKDKQGKDDVKESYYRNFEKENGVKSHAELKEIKERAAEEAMRKAAEKLRKFC